MCTTGIYGTGGKFATSVNNISKYWEFSKIFLTALMIYSGAWGELIHEKTLSEILVALSLSI
jgi:hypothetical protein